MPALGNLKISVPLNLLPGCLTSGTRLPTCFLNPYIPRVMHSSSWHGGNSHCLQSSLNARSRSSSPGPLPALGGFLTQRPSCPCALGRDPPPPRRAPCLSISILPGVLPCEAQPLTFWTCSFVASSQGSLWALLGHVCLEFGSGHSDCYSQHHRPKASRPRRPASFTVQLSHLCMTTGKPQPWLGGPLLPK